MSDKMSDAVESFRGRAKRGTGPYYSQAREIVAYIDELEKRIAWLEEDLELWKVPGYERDDIDKPCVVKVDADCCQQCGKREGCTCVEDQRIEDRMSDLIG